MKLELITFETAKLAKRKGFNHMKANCYGDNMCYQLPKGELINALKGNTVSGYILAPTQDLLQKWLRENHNIFVEVNEHNICNIKRRSENGHWCTKFSTRGEGSYEDNREEGLFKALTFFVKNKS